MFKHLDENIENRVRTSGKLSVELVTRGISYDNCNITYNKITAGTEVVLRRLFTCSICYTQLSMMMWEINRYEGNHVFPNEAEQYLFLQLLIETAEERAIKAGMHSMSLSSGLPHMSELLVDNGFTLKAMEFVPDIKTYSGMKMLSKIITREEK